MASVIYMRGLQSGHWGRGTRNPVTTLSHPFPGSYHRVLYSHHSGPDLKTCYLVVVRAQDATGSLSSRGHSVNQAVGHESALKPTKKTTREKDLRQAAAEEDEDRLEKDDDSDSDRNISQIDTMNHPREPSRLRQGLNPLVTSSLGGPYHQHNAPLSAVSLTSSNLYALQTPVNSAIQPYNPQEWIGSPAVGADRSHPFPESQGKSELPQIPPPSPPPHYVRHLNSFLTDISLQPIPPWNQQRPGSVNFDSTPAANTSTPRMPPASIRPSPEPVAQTSFPPPPGTTGRGSSRERRFGLSFRRHHHQEQSSPPESVPPVPSVPRPPPPQIQIPLVQPIPERTGSNSSQPPGARRAVSTGAIETPTSARSRSASQTRWAPGMPLPPPPPGPPPAASRSQSVQDISRSSEPIVSPPTRRPPPSNGSALGPVPPTPADWDTQGNQNVTSGRGRPVNLTIDTANAVNAAQAGEPNPSVELMSAATLSRTGAVRRDKTIVQRRAESRTREAGASDESSAPPIQLTDIVVPNATTLSRRRTITKSTPRSGGRTIHDTPRTGEGESSNRDSRNLTPKPQGSAQHPHDETTTPPFSPHPQKAAAMANTASSSVVPKALPTPPAQSRSSSASQLRDALTPDDGLPLSATVPRQLVVSQTTDQFCQGTIERFQAFATKEAVAASDVDRVRLFADFIVNESRIRRERYSSAIGAMGSEIFDLTRDLFRPMSSRRASGVFHGESEYTPRSSEASRSHRSSMNSLYRDSNGAQSSSAPPSANLASSPGKPLSATNANWSSNYMPSLSPILSLSVSGNGDGSSRGRPSSRWWETDSTGNGNNLLERSKRESKYMSMPKEAREALQWAESPIQEDSYAASSERDSSSTYPAEKTGWHEQDPVLTPQPSRTSAQSFASSSSPSTPNPAHLDVSRLITLPPPYPRHYPAVNNNHPELAAMRTTVRQISDLTEVEGTKERFLQSSRKKREEAAKAAAERRAALRKNLQQEINTGAMSFEEASAIDQDSSAAEKETIKELERTDFELFQSQVVAPLNELVTGRIAKATALFDDLSSRLFDDDVEGGGAAAAAAAADMPQEEGDDRPELLEKLRLLKWIFECRETLHRAIFDILSDRNDRYRDVVVTPYRLANNTEKVRSAEAFFKQDAARRRAAFAAEVLERTKAFRDVTERTVVRGVEVQLSAFWDIAPPLRRLLDKIPADLAGTTGFGVQIPAQEYQENPSYRQHPLQYLFSLLLHSEKSSYQLIESQTNLLCLLHEVKEAEAHASANVVRHQVGGEDEIEPTAEQAAERAARAEALRREEEKRLTEDLKEKVRVVEDQWQSALGEAIRQVKQAVGAWLLQTGGWDESLEEGGVGSTIVDTPLLSMQGFWHSIAVSCIIFRSKCPGGGRRRRR
ncbi:hypothetical protein ACRALDRAFT_2047933 [Sodiomyces alcalophilus JCM 7366]|uniref:uncharacterized protein n=1 Tax=Sodiomyces alcalophilus JCM 7366 TaxID=591952 RepID=UPI0039B6C638